MFFEYCKFFSMFFYIFFILYPVELPNMVQFLLIKTWTFTVLSYFIYIRGNFKTPKKSSNAQPSPRKRSFFGGYLPSSHLKLPFAGLWFCYLTLFWMIFEITSLIWFYLLGTVFFEYFVVTGGYNVSAAADKQCFAAGGEDGLQFRFNILRRFIAQTAFAVGI